MTIRERGSLWPMIVVGSVAFLVLLMPPLVLQRNESSRMATVEAQVTIGDANNAAKPEQVGPQYRWPNSEVPRTAERLRDAAGLAIAAISNLVAGELRGQKPRDSGDVVRNIAHLQLIPSEWLTNQSGVLRTPHGTIHLRYSPTKLSVEVLSVPNDRAFGPALLIRIPDAENTMVGPRYFESMQLDGIVYPHPFAPIDEVISLGWQPRLFKQTQLPDAEKAQLEQWAKTIHKKPE